MANITEKDIIDHLKEKVRFHQQEAKRIESVLSAFNDTPSAKVKKEAKAATPETAPVKAAKAPKDKASKPLEIPAEYSPNLTLNGKISYALNHIGSGTGEDIAKKITELQPKLEASKVTQQISGVLSTLKSKGLLTAAKEGRKDRYSLLEK